MTKRGQVASRIATLKHGQKKADASIDASTQNEAAGMLNVSRRTAARGRKVLEKGADALVAISAAKSCSTNRFSVR